MNLGEEAVERARRVRLFLCDVDGILTDASVYFGPGGEWKRFNIRDGLGLRLLQRAGIPVGWVSARPSPATSARAEDLKIDYLHQDPAPKVLAVEQILARAGATWETTCFMGDDVVDLGVLRRVGFAVVPPDALEEARGIAHAITQLPGGQGAVRECVEWILKSQGKWEGMIADFSA